MSPVISCDLRSSFGAVRNQGSRPTCVAFAVSDAHAAARGTFAALSVEHVYFHAVRRTPGGNPQSGVSLGKVLDAVRIDGQAGETGWPYLVSLPSDLTKWVPPATATPVFRRDSITVGASINMIVSQLDSGIPPVLTFMISLAFCEAEKGIVAPRSSDADVGWHAVIAVGHAQTAGIDEPLRRMQRWWANCWAI